MAEDPVAVGVDPQATLPRGTIDMHVHASPDVQPRLLDAREAAQAAERVGMAGIVLKDHHLPTTDRAYLLNQKFSKLRVYGTLALNRTVGGLNPEAVAAALGHGVRMLYFPTQHAGHWLRARGLSEAGLGALDPEGRLLPPVYEILDLLAGRPVVLNTGHLSPRESLALIREARARGIERILVGHASNPAIGYTVEEQREAVRMGALIEHAYVSAAPHSSFPAPLSAMLGQVRELGASACVLSSDLGQVGNPSPVEGLAHFAQAAREARFSESEVETMLVHNPAWLLADG